MVKKLFYKMLIAQVLSAMTVMIAMVVDSIMIGQFLGSDAMAAYGFASPVVLLLTAIANTLSVGTQVVCSNALGSGKHEKINEYFSVAVVFTTIIAILGMIISISLHSPLASLVGATKGSSVHTMTGDYMIGFYIGAPALIGSLVMVPFMQLAGEQFRLIIAVVSMTIADITLDLLNVKVFHGGLLGMGLASSISYYIAFFIGLSYFFQKKSIYKFSIKIIKLNRIKEIIKNGSTTIINLISGVLFTFLLNQILSSAGGNDNVAAYSVLNTLVNLSYSVLIGITSIVLMLSGIFYEESDKKAIHELLKTSFVFAIISHFIITIIIFVFSQNLVGLFLHSGISAYKIATIAVKLFALSLTPSVINAILKNYYQGTKRIRLSQILAVLQNFACLIISAFILNKIFGIEKIWFCYLSGEILTLVIITIITWTNNHKINISTKNYAMLPQNFGVPDNQFFDASIKNEEDVIKISEEAGEFCKKHCNNNKIVLYISLCIEEMAKNIVEYGFKDGKEHTIDIRLLYKEDDWILRIRDDCYKFDPVSFAEKVNKNQQNQIGIRMIYSLVKDIKYNYTMSLNNLTITL